MIEIVHGKKSTNTNHYTLLFIKQFYMNIMIIKN